MPGCGAVGAAQPEPNLADGLGGDRASLMQAWLSSSRFRNQPVHHSVSLALDPPTGDPRRLITAAHSVLGQMVEGHPYNRAGILLTGLAPAGSQPLLWGEPDPASSRLAAAVDEVATRFGKASIGYGPTGLRAAPRWQMRREKLSPAATTRWDQLLSVR